MPKAVKQHTWTAPEQRTVNAGRVSQIIFHPQSQRVEVTYALGEESGGVFTERPDLRCVVGFDWDSIPLALQTDLLNMEEKAIQYAQGNPRPGEESGTIFSAGTLETDPSS